MRSEINLAFAILFLAGCSSTSKSVDPNGELKTDVFSCRPGAKDSGDKNKVARWCTAWKENGDALYHGSFWRWYPNGQVAEKSYFIWGNIEGIQSAWYENGKKANEGLAKDGNRIGLWNFWDEQGNVQDKVDYQKDHAHEIGFYPSGAKKIEGSFNAGKKLGTWIYWDEKGKEKGKCEFKDGLFDKSNKACGAINELFPTGSDESEEANILHVAG